MDTGIEASIDYDALIAGEAAAFFEAAERYLKPDDVQMLRQAFSLSREAHEGQSRKSGEPYITHPLAVATMLTDWRLDAQGLAAALLHDVLEDTGVGKPTLIEKFGKVIADLPRVALVVGRYYSRPSVLFEVPLFQHSELTASPVQANFGLKQFTEVALEAPLSRHLSHYLHQAP